VGTNVKFKVEYDRLEQSWLVLQDGPEYYEVVATGMSEQMAKWMAEAIEEMESTG